jgi:antitoxin component YwqK of YwqJK toxin-antitoxin module
MSVTYNTSGTIASTSKIEDGSNYIDNMTFTYNDANQLTEADYDDGYVILKYTFEYTSGILSKKTFYQNQGPGTAVTLYRYYTYVFTNGNITDMKEFDGADNLQGETTYTYNSDANLFQTLGLLNTYNAFGADDLANLDTYFNKNLTATATTASDKINYTYTYNTHKQLTKVVVSAPYATYTRMFGY